MSFDKTKVTWTYRDETWTTSLVGLYELGAHGRSWYSDAYRELDAYAAKRRLHTGYVVDVLSILSPRVPVSLNIALMRDYVERRDTSRLMGSRRKALETYEKTGEFNGPKINAFARALKGDAEAVVIDTWMYRAAGFPSNPKKSDYARCETIVRSAAREVGETPRETQASIWTGIRKVCGLKPAEVIIND